MFFAIISFPIMELSADTATPSAVFKSTRNMGAVPNGACCIVGVSIMRNGTVSAAAELATAKTDPASLPAVDMVAGAISVFMRLQKSCNDTASQKITAHDTV
jgi:hypothetical protein